MSDKLVEQQYHIRMATGITSLKRSCSIKAASNCDIFANMQQQ